MDDITHDKFDYIDKKLTQICTRQETLISDITDLKIESSLNKNKLEFQQKSLTTQLRAGKIVVIVAWTLLGIIGVLMGNTIRQQFNYSNSADFTHQQEINTINDRLLKLEEYHGTNQQPIR